MGSEKEGGRGGAEVRLRMVTHLVVVEVVVVVGGGMIRQSALCERKRTVVGRIVVILFT